MKARTLASVFLWLSSMLAGGCSVLGPGYMGPIQPPAKEIPVLVNDIRALQYGDEILVAFSISDRTTEGLPLKSLRSVDLYAGPNGPDASDPNGWSKSATHYSVPATMPGPFQHRIPAQPWLGKELVLRVRSTGPKGKVSLWSLPYTLGVIMPPARPSDLMAESRKDGVHLTWHGSGPKYRVLRSAGTEAPAPIADTDKPEYIDESVQFGMSYQYMVLAFADDQHQSATSEPFKTPTLADIFPPEAPTGVTATAGVNSIELEWDLNTEADFKGYNVFRSVDGGPYEKVASLITAATYHDMDVQAGKTYRYQISAVDLLNNESQRSAPVQAALQ